MHSDDRQTRRYLLIAFFACCAFVAGVFSSELIWSFMYSHQDPNINRSLSVKESIPANTELPTTAPMPEEPNLRTPTPTRVTKKYPSLLIVMRTSPPLYAGRLPKVRSTWAKSIQQRPDQRLLIVGGNHTDGTNDMVTSTCVIEGRLQGNNCCKTAAMVLEAQKVLKTEKYDWIYFVDDDTYVFPDNVQRVLSTWPDQSKPVVHGFLGCGTTHCGGICGGGGYIMNEAVIEKLTKEYDSSKYENFTAEFLETCAYCEYWEDIGLPFTCSNRRLGVSLNQLNGTYPWSVDATELNRTMNLQDTIPLLYHYNAQADMEGVHKLATHFQSNQVISASERKHTKSI